MGPLKKALDAIKPSSAHAGMSEASPGVGDDPGTAPHYPGDLARRMFEDSALAMVLGKLSGKIVEANPAFCRILGYTEAELKELTVFDLTHADDLPGMKERRKAHIEDNVESFPLEKRYIHKDGHAVWVRGTSSLVRDANGQPAFVLGQLQDITGTKKLEEEARAERENYRLALESVADGVVLFDKDGKFVFCNSAYRKNLEPIQDLLVPGTPFETIVRATAEKGLITIPKGDLEGYVRRRITRRQKTHKQPFILQFTETDRWVVVNEYRTADGGTFVVRTDITERKKIEDGLLESQSHFLAAIDNMAEGFALYDAEDRLVQCNQKYLEAFGPEVVESFVHGVTFEDMIRTAAKYGYFSVDGQSTEQAIQERLEHHRDPQGPIEVQRGNGRWFLVNESKIPGGGTVLLRQDITDSKKAEEAVRESEERLKIIIDTVPAIITVKDRESRYLLTNRYHKDLFGFSQEELQGKTPAFFSAEHGIKMKDLERTVMETGEVMPYFDYSLVDTEGRNRDLMVIKAPLADLSGEIVGTVTAAIDITERKRVEEELRESRELLQALTDNLPVFISLKDTEGRFQFVNRLFEKWVCMDRRDIIGKTVHDIYPKEQADRFAIEDQEVIDNGAVKSVEKDLLYPDGFTRSVVSTRFPVFSQAGEVTGLGTINFDISERKRAEEQLKTIIESLSEGFLYFDADDRLVLVNSKIADIYPLVADVFVPGVSYETCMRMGVERGQWGPDDGQDKEEWIQERLDYHYDPKGFVEYNLPDGTCIRVEEKRTPDGGVVGVRTDITELKKIERELRNTHDELERRVEERTAKLHESEARFRTVVDSSPAGITLKGTDGRFLMVNRTFGNWVNADPSKIEGKTVYDFLPKEQADEVESLDRKIFETGEETVAEGTRTFLDGVSRAVITHKCPVIGPAGEIVAVSTIITDISERKRFEEALKESGEKLREILEKSPIGVAIVTHSDDDARLTGNRLYVNTAFVHMFGGSSADELLGSQIFDSWVDHDQLRHVEKVMRARDDLVDYEALRRRLDGTEWWVSMNSRSIRFEGQDCSMVWHSDITERKRADEALRERTVALSEKVKEHRRAEEALRTSEQRLRSIMENIVEAVITISEDGTIESFNPAAEKMFGFVPDEVLGENVSMLASEPDRSRHDQYLHNYLHTGEGKIIGIGFREVRARHKDGTAFMAELAISEIGHGPWRQFVGTLRDVTERKQAEEALRAAKERAEFANRAKTEFLAHMSHELRTPLNAILGYSDILKAEMFGPLGNEKYPEYVENIRDAGSHLLTILSDILDVSKVEAGELDIKDGEVDLVKIIQDCRSMVQEKADLAKIRLTVKTARKLPRLRADGPRLKQILLNLLTNAIKFTPEKGKVTVHATTDKAGGVVLRVADTGIGIAAEDIPRVLQPFGQVKDAYINTPEEGSGLGLSLVKALTELHGGTLDLDSAPGQGTRVTVTFPPERSLAD